MISGPEPGALPITSRMASREMRLARHARRTPQRAVRLSSAADSLALRIRFVFHYFLTVTLLTPLADSKLRCESGLSGFAP